MIIQRDLNVMKIKDLTNKILLVDGVYGPATMNSINVVQSGYKTLTLKYSYEH